MKKIAFFTQNLSVGGVQKIVKILVKHFSKIYDVSLILAEDDKALNFEFTRIYKIKTPKIDLSEPQIGEKLINYRVKELEKFLIQIKPSLLFSFEDYNNIIALKANFCCKKIISSRVSITNGYTNQVHLLGRKFYVENIVKLYDKADICVCVSDLIKSELLSLNPQIRVGTIYNGVKLHTIKDKIHDNFILNIGRLHPQKGQSDLLKAFALIKNEISENLVIVGEGKLREKLWSETISLGLENRVEFTGFVDPMPFIKKCKIAVVASYYEGFSNSVLEIMGENKAILAYNYAGASEILPSEDLVELGDVDSLANHLKELLQDENKLKDLEIRQGRKICEFSIEKMLSNYELAVLDVLCAE